MANLMVIPTSFLKEYIYSIEVSKRKYFELLIEELNTLNNDNGIEFDNYGNPSPKENKHAELIN